MILDRLLGLVVSVDDCQGGGGAFQLGFGRAVLREFVQGRLRGGHADGRGLFLQCLDLFFDCLGRFLRGLPALIDFDVLAFQFDPEMFCGFRRRLAVFTKRTVVKFVDSLSGFRLDSVNIGRRLFHRFSGGGKLAATELNRRRRKPGEVGSLGLNLSAEGNRNRG
ncbi:hypothetical protein D3C84_413030 [compost metagenome]